MIGVLVQEISCYFSNEACTAAQMPVQKCQRLIALLVSSTQGDVITGEEAWNPNAAEWFEK